MNVLILDDSKTMVRIISNTISKMGSFNIKTGEDGLEGVNIWKENKGNFDIILTDWNMPNMNGLDFVKFIREKNKLIPIIMITTEAGKSEVITALRAGVNNYICKPFSAEILKEKLTDILKG